MLHSLRVSFLQFAVPAALLTLGAAGLSAQMPPQPAQQAQPAVLPRAPSGYVLGPGDVIALHAPDLPGVAGAPLVVSEDGHIVLPQIGRLRVSGFTLAQVENVVREHLSVTVRAPQVYASLLRFRSEFVFLIGAFVRPGPYPYEGNRKLSELLSAAGGLAPNANRIVKVTRQLEYGRIPLERARVYPDREVSEVEIDARRLVEAISSPEDLFLQPSDVVTAGIKERIYVSGTFLRPGALELEDRDYLNVSQAISIAGLGPDASLEKAVVLRSIDDTNRRASIPVNAKRIMQGRERDFPLLPNDVLVVPQKRGTVRWVLSIALPTAAGAAIYALLR